MTEKEFLDTLYEQLSDQIPDSKASAHTQYYQDYIRNEIRNGKKEQDVLQSLGDPRLIAKTLIDTGAEPDSRFESSQEEVYHSSQSKHRRYRLDLSTWYGKLIVILAAVAVLVLLFLAVSFMLPVILITGAVFFLISWFRKRK